MGSSRLYGEGDLAKSLSNLDVEVQSLGLRRLLLLEDLLRCSKCFLTVVAVLIELSEVEMAKLEQNYDEVR